MNSKELEQMIKDSLADCKLDLDEKYAFKELANTLETEQLRFIKNKAFELGRPYIEKGGSEAIRVYHWLERLLKAIQPHETNFTMKPSAYFSPGDACRVKIIALIKQAKHSINICVFTISDNIIVREILAAHKRGIKVVIISDNDKANDKGSDIDRLSAQGVQVILDHSPHHMHHKFAIFDDKILLNGSFNWTRSATDVNQENILVTANSELVLAYIEKFQALKKRFS